MAPASYFLFLNLPTALMIQFKGPGVLTSFYRRIPWSQFGSVMPSS